MLDNSDFIDTDIPLEVSLPDKPGISVGTMATTSLIMCYIHLGGQERRSEGVGVSSIHGSKGWLL